VSLEARIALSRGDFRLDAEFRVGLGETVALVGPNGAGKSTLVDALAGLLRVDRGRVVLDGECLDAPAQGLHLPPRQRSIGVLFQQLYLFPQLSVRDNVSFPLVARGQRWRAARAETADLLERLGLAPIARRRARELSGGEAQQVALARALAPRPKLLLLDEPLSALDVERRPRLRQVLRELLDEVAGVRLLITHDRTEARRLADRFVVLEAGRVVQAGTPAELSAAPRTPYVASLFAE
jgi:molybdate transport system ATP-binding protein